MNVRNILDHVGPVVVLCFWIILQQASGRQIQTSLLEEFLTGSGDHLFPNDLPRDQEKRIRIAVFEVIFDRNTLARLKSATRCDPKTASFQKVGPTDCNLCCTDFGRLFRRRWHCLNKM